MDKWTTYNELIKKAICSSPYCVYGSADSAIETVCLSDEAEGHHVLMDVGWRGKERICSTIIYVRLKNDKVWIEEDCTEDGIADALVRAGIPREDIVLGFQHPKMRPYTEFAAV